jgi:hypothetical protein
MLVVTTSVSMAVNSKATVAVWAPRLSVNPWQTGLEFIRLARSNYFGSSETHKHCGKPIAAKVIRQCCASCYYYYYHDSDYYDYPAEKPRTQQVQVSNW